MDIKIFKTCVIIPFYIKKKCFDEIEENDIINESHISINNGKKTEWVNKKALSLFDKDNKNCYVKRYDIKNDKLTPMTVSNKNIEGVDNRKLYISKKNYYIKNYEDLKFSIDNVQLWLMKSSNGFLTYEISIIDCFNSKKKDSPISKEKCYDLLFRLQRCEEILYDVPLGKGKKEVFKFNMQNYIYDIFNSSDIFNSGDIDENTFDVDSTMLLNYIVSEDITSDEASIFLNKIRKDYNPKNPACTNDKIDDGFVYYNKDYNYKWLATEKNITMLGDSCNDYLTSKGIVMQSVFDRHLCIFLFYKNLVMMCDKVKEECEHDGIIKKAYGKSNTCKKMIEDLLKCGNIINRKEFLNLIIEHDRKKCYKYLYNGEENFIGGIAVNDSSGKSDHLNIIYAYYYAIKINSLNIKIGEIVSQVNEAKVTVESNVKKYIKVGIEVARLVFPLIKGDNESNKNNEKCS